NGAVPDSGGPLPPAQCPGMPSKHESTMSRRPLLVVVLAAGQGTRMKSALPKVLHKIGGGSMLAHVLAVGQSIGADALSVVIGPDMESVRAEALKQAPTAKVFVQERQRGTADAVLAAREALAALSGDVLVLYGDTPLLSEATLEALRARLDEGAGV